MKLSDMTGYDPATNRIIGFMGDVELIQLYEWASQAETVIEVGSWHGRSTHALLSGCKGRVYAVDHFKGNPQIEDMTAGLARFLSEYGQHIKDVDAFTDHFASSMVRDLVANVGHIGTLTVVPSNSTQAAARLPDADMIFIDADHSYDAVKADIAAWWPKCKKRLCGHDLQEGHPGVKEALDESGLAYRSIPDTWLWEVVR